MDMEKKNSQLNSPNTIFVDGTQGSFFKGTAKIFLNQLFNEVNNFSSDETNISHRKSKNNQTMNQIINDLNIVKEWISYSGGDITKDQLERWEITYLSYIASGNAPSIQLEEPFKNFRKAAIDENWKTISLPSKIIDVLDRMHATDKDIFRKRASKRAKSIVDVMAVINEPVVLEKKESKLKARLKRLNKVKGIILVINISWCLFVLLRWFDDIQIAGLYFEKWGSRYDDHIFLVDLLILPVISFVSYKSFKWIKAGPAE